MSAQRMSIILSDNARAREAGMSRTDMDLKSRVGEYRLYIGRTDLETYYKSSSQFLVPRD